MRDITIAEELILLLLNGETSFVSPIPEWRLSCALVGAILLDLSFKERIDADLEKLFVLDPTLTGDDLLDRTLATVAAETDPHGVQYWIERVALQGGDINEMVFDHLVQRGILVALPRRGPLGALSCGDRQAGGGGPEPRDARAVRGGNPQAPRCGDRRPGTGVRRLQGDLGVRGVRAGRGSHRGNRRHGPLRPVGAGGGKAFVLASGQHPRRNATAGERGLVGVFEVGVVPRREPAEVPCGASATTWPGLCAQATGHAVRRSRRCGGEPLGGPQGPASPTGQGLHR